MAEPIIERAPGDPRQKKIHPGLKFALEMGPLIVFFLVTYKGDWLTSLFPVLGEIGKPIFIATAVFMVTSVIALAVSWALTRTLALMPLVSGIVVLFFGTLTLWLHDDTFIKMKPTLVYALFGGLLLGGLAFGKPLLGYVFDQAFELDQDGWRKLTFRWGLFFLGCAVLNEIVWRTLGHIYPPELADKYWAGFKLFGFMALTFLFMLTQMPLIARHSPEKKEEE
ncbi:MAG: septation protein A [Rhizobiales bacterium 65-79]|jgi:intracellular septation protein|nr:septation protein A [Hyphomicrobiales bacterium]OJU03651.1 MAG: septation protein A [Rhizobiales bacterium 65-79]